MIGLDPDTILTLVTISNVVLIFFFVFKIVQEVYDSETGFYTCLMTLFILSCMGRGEVLLPSSFWFSAPFYLAGLWLYLKPGNSTRVIISAAALWGIAFLISPVYVFLLGLTFLYDLFISRRRRRFLIMVVTFLITITPFFIQGIYIYSQNLWGASAFSFWRGIPDLQWWSDLGIRFISPSMGRFEVLSAVFQAVILIFAIFVFVREKRVFWFIPVALLSYFLTFYHFNGQYASRIQIFFSIFVVAEVIHYRARILKHKRILILALSPFIIFSVVKHYAVTVPTYKIGIENQTNIMKSASGLYGVMDRYLENNKYLFCTKDTFRKYILGRFPAHDLGVWRTMDYYQLNHRIAEQLEDDYQEAFNSTDYALIEKIADKYDIDRALICGDDQNLPLAKTLLKHWNAVYVDRYFCILSKPI